MEKIKQGSKVVFVLLVGMVIMLGGCSLTPQLEQEVFSEYVSEMEVPVLQASGQIKTLLSVLNEAEQLAKGYYYKEAIKLLKNVPDEYKENEVVLKQIEIYKKAKNSFVPYEEPVRHIFFHSLIVDTSLAFDGDYMENGYNYWMTTVDEFKAMLEELYANDFILIDIHDLAVKTVDKNGKVNFKANAPFVPEGKKPLILSVDDVNYYEYMEKDGFARNLMINENGEVKNLYIDEAGNELVGDYDVVPILDAFVKEHPDFSLRGAKGILALTGYEGTLGYDTHLADSKTLKKDKKAAKAVAKRLKETGWQFAIHGFGHRDAKQISASYLQADTERWFKEVGSLVGETDIYIYPYGSEIDYSTQADKLSYFQSVGLYYYCGVWSKAFVQVNNSYVRQTRANLDGFSMITRPGSMEDMFDIEKVLDKSRPELR